MLGNFGHGSSSCVERWVGYGIPGAWWLAVLDQTCWTVWNFLGLFSVQVEKTNSVYVVESLSYSKLCKNILLHFGFVLAPGIQSRTWPGGPGRAQRQGQHRGTSLEPWMRSVPRVSVRWADQLEVELNCMEEADLSWTGNCHYLLLLNSRLVWEMWVLIWWG